MGAIKTTRKKTCAAVAALILADILFTGCSAPGGNVKAQTQVDTETLCIITQGRETAVYDRSGGSEYHFKAKRAKHKDAPQTPRTAADTNTVKITLLQGGDIEVKDRTAGKIYIVHRGR